MSKRSISALTIGRNFLLSNLARNNLCLYFDKKFKLKWFNKNSLLSPKVIYANYIIKRDFSDDYNRHNYNEEVENLINRQICVEFGAGHAYLNMASFYGRSDVALPGLHGFFMKMYYEEQEHALGFIKYQNLRGGCVKLTNIPTLSNNDWSDICGCFEVALEMEKTVKEDLCTIYCKADELRDIDVTNMLDAYIENQEKSIYEFSRLITRAKLLLTNPVGKFLLDKEIHQTHVRKNPAICKAEIGSKLYT